MAYIQEARRCLKRFLEALDKDKDDDDRILQMHMTFSADGKNTLENKVFKIMSPFKCCNDVIWIVWLFLAATIFRLGEALGRDGKVPTHENDAQRSVQVNIE